MADTTRPSSPRAPAIGSDGSDPGNEARIKSELIAIRNDASLPAKEKAQRMQSILMRSFQLASAQRGAGGGEGGGRGTARVGTARRVVAGNGGGGAGGSLAGLGGGGGEPGGEGRGGAVAAAAEAVPAASYHDEEAGVFGCAHYSRRCQLWAACCGRYFPCRLCHDEAVPSHRFDRHATTRVACMGCATEQPAARACAGRCGQPFARYFCAVCKFYDDAEGKDIYHCEKCHMCRVGKGLGIDYFHCDRCNACMSTMLREHVCVERSLESDCPICHEFMFDSTTPVMFVPCGHCMHVACYEAYTATNYVCPLCCKSLGDMSGYFGRIDAVMAEETMPPQFAGVRARISCSDCEARSVAPYHFVYHKCARCGSYNTNVLQQLPKGAQVAEGEGEAALSGVGVLGAAVGVQAAAGGGGDSDSSTSTAVTPPSPADVTELVSMLGDVGVTAVGAAADAESAEGAERAGLANLTAAADDDGAVSIN